LYFVKNVTAKNVIIKNIIIFYNHIERLTNILVFEQNRIYFKFPPFVVDIICLICVLHKPKEKEKGISERGKNNARMGRVKEKKKERQNQKWKRSIQRQRKQKSQ
jgi:hypothetical protein